MEKENILTGYIQLTRKLGKFPTIYEVIKFLCSERQIRTHFNGMIGLKKEAIVADPTLQRHIMPAVLQAPDIESYRLSLEEKKNDKLNKSTIANVSTLDYIAKFSELVFNGKVTPVKIPKTKKEFKRALNLTLSDLHFGADIKAEETGYLTYGTIQEARRLAEVVKQTIEYKPQYRTETDLIVNLLGDLFEGKLHDSENAGFLSEQICRTIHLLSQGLAQLAENFPKVTVFCATGNHGRIKSRHMERATSGKWDSLETIVYYSLQKILCKYTNLTFVIPKTPYVEYKILGHNIFATHGDTVLKIGNPGKSINVSNFETQITKMNNNRHDVDKIKVGICGHMHCASVSNLNTGVVMITNGTLQPIGPFDVSLGIRENRASQTLFETTEDHAVGDIRFLRIGEKEDNNEALDSIIKPFVGFQE